MNRLFKQIKKLKIYLNSIDRQTKTDVDFIITDNAKTALKKYDKKLAKYRKTKKAIKTCIQRARLKQKI